MVLLAQESPEPADAQRKVSVWFEPRWVQIDESIAKLEAQQHRRVIKSHLPLDGLPYYPQVQYIVVGRDARDVFMSLWNHHANYAPGFLDFLNGLPDRVGDPMPAAPDNIHEFWRGWSTQGWFPWESEGYPYWGNLHHTRTWWAYRHLPNILFVHYNDLLTDTLHPSPAICGRRRTSIRCRNRLPQRRHVSLTTSKHILPLYLGIGRNS